MKNVKVLLVAIGGYGAAYMTELTEKDVPGVYVEVNLRGDAGN